MAGRGDYWWEWPPGDEEAVIATMADMRALILDVGVPFLARFESPSAVADALLDPDPRLRDAHSVPNDNWSVEVLAYSLVLAGRDREVNEAFARLREVTIDSDERAAWWAETRRLTPRAEPKEDPAVAQWRRAELVLKTYKRSPNRAVAILDGWCAEQLAGLRLPRTA